MGGVKRLSARLPLDPARPADLDRLRGGGRVDLDAELRAQPDVAMPKIGPGPARQTAELMWPTE
eukprot:1933576-Alexandrium_andersonii.AAC.1